VTSNDDEKKAEEVGVESGGMYEITIIMSLKKIVYDVEDKTVGDDVRGTRREL
jgi:hypothetical protein